MTTRALILGLAAATAACIPPGNAPSDSGTTSKSAGFRPSTGIMNTAFVDTFDRSPADASAPSTGAPEAAPADAGRQKVKNVDDAGRSSAARAESVAALEAGVVRSEVTTKNPADLGPDWSSTAPPGIWRIENGRLCGEHARNRGVWLNRVLPVNARIEFDAVSYSNDGDLKAEVWGDGRSSATTQSYTNASSYLTIFGGWGNTLHVLARVDEHGKDRKSVEANAGGTGRTKSVVSGHVYKFKVERVDGQTIRWFVDGIEIHTFVDSEPLAGMGHDHFAFNDWEAKVCFDNVKVTAL